MKLKVLKMDELPKGAKRRVVIERDESSNDWVRDTQDCCFMLWSNCERAISTETVYDPDLKRHVEVECPYEEITDEEGYGTGEYKPKPNLIIFELNMYEHSGRHWSLSGSGFVDPWDTAQGVAVLYTDEKRWKSLGGKAEWQFVDGEPSDELYTEARRIAQGEVEDMNLCEDGEYYSWRLDTLSHEDSVVTETRWDGTVVRESVQESTDFWDMEDSCGGYLTGKPARDMDFPLGVPVVASNDYLVGDTFEQECFALMDEATGKYVKVIYDEGKPKHELVNDVKFATLNAKPFLDNNKELYEKDMGRMLSVVNVTKEVWDAYPECQVK
jgi:hypothetical protein